MSEARRGHWKRYGPNFSGHSSILESQEKEMTTEDSSRYKVKLASAYKTSCYGRQSPEEMSEHQVPDNELHNPGMHCWALIEHGCF